MGLFIFWGGVEKVNPVDLETAIKEEEYIMNTTTIVTKMKTMTAYDKAEWLEEVAVSERAQIISLMTKDELAEVFRLLSSEAREELLEALSDPDIAELIQLQESDDLVDVLQEMPANLVIKLLEYVPNERREMINNLLHYPEESVGSLMSVDFVTAKEGSTKTQILNQIQLSSGGPEHLNQVYIIDDNRHLTGFIHLLDLVKSSDESIDKLIQYTKLSVQTNDDQEIASDLFLKYQLLSIPVVDSENRLVGILTADDIFEVISDEIHEDYVGLSGVTKNEEQKKTYLERTVWSLAKERIGWLLFLMVSATLTAYVIQKYEAVLATSVVLAAYIPMLMDSGGNSGTQSSTLITRSISLNEISKESTWDVIWKETRIGLLTGFILAVVNFTRIMIMDDVEFNVALTVSFTLIIVVVMSKVLGGVLPMIAERFNQDPAVMAGPLITTFVDTFALIIYFQTASFLLGL